MTSQGALCIAVIAAKVVIVTPPVVAAGRRLSLLLRLTCDFDRSWSLCRPPHWSWGVCSDWGWGVEVVRQAVTCVEYFATPIRVLPLGNRGVVGCTCRLCFELDGDGKWPRSCATDMDKPAIETVRRTAGEGDASWNNISCMMLR
mmetsp:Transcript_21566/g.25975  ORF Transcript_21566/g.25975 Transcript_21566/m.25975 type:complete len:145 (-) Transcript_21566:130-564(-)